MKVVRTYRVRSQAEDAANFLMSKGIASNVHDSRILIGLLNDGKDGVDVEVQDTAYDRANELLSGKENGSSSILSGLDFLKSLKKKSKAE